MGNRTALQPFIAARRVIRPVAPFRDQASTTIQKNRADRQPTSEQRPMGKLKAPADTNTGVIQGGDQVHGHSAT